MRDPCRDGSDRRQRTFETTNSPDRAGSPTRWRFIIGGVVGGFGCGIGAEVAFGGGFIVGWFVGWLVFSFFGIAVGTFIKGDSLGNAFHNYIVALKMIRDD